MLRFRSGYIKSCFDLRRLGERLATSFYFFAQEMSGFTLHDRLRTRDAQRTLRGAPFITRVEVVSIVRSETVRFLFPPDRPNPERITQNVYSLRSHHVSGNGGVQDPMCCYDQTSEQVNGSCTKETEAALKLSPC